MSRQLRLEFPGALWHVTSRGNERRDIVRDDHDRRQFVHLLGDVVEERRWLLHAWVLMSNHYHLLVETPEIGLSRGVKALNQEYASWFNSRHDRVGHLFQGRFKGILVERETHLLELVRYLVLNPVRAGIAWFAGDYEWSNYRATAGLFAPPSWLEIEWTLRQFAGDPLGAHEAYRQFVAAGREASYDPWESVIGQIYLGSDEFRERMQERVESRKQSAEHPKPQRFRTPPDIDTLRSLVLAEFAVGEADLLQRSRGYARKAVAHLAADAGFSLLPIASIVNATSYAVSKMRDAGRKLYASDAEYREHIDRIRAQLS